MKLYIISLITGLVSMTLGIIAALDVNTMALASVAITGGVSSALMTAYGMYRKINKDYGIDAYNSLKEKYDNLKEAYDKMTDLLKTQNELIDRLKETKIVYEEPRKIVAELSQTASSSKEILGEHVKDKS